MRSLLVYADFDFLPAPLQVGVLNFDQVRGNEVYSFAFSPEWLKQYGGITLSKDLFTAPGLQYATDGIFGCFSDALPDRWGRTLAEKKEILDAKREHRPVRTLTSFDYLLALDDYMRMGGLRFKEKEDGLYLNDEAGLRVPPFATIRELAAAAEAVERSEEKGSLPQERWLFQLLNPGTSLGGARPKSNILDKDGQLAIAKYPSRSDRYDVALWEHFCHLLAVQCGISAAQTRVEENGKKYHILLSRRFDRREDGRRLHFASALTQLGFKDGEGADEGKGYLDIVDFILQACPDTEKNLEELYRRVAFNICIGNGDDHFRNHGFLLSAKGWTLAPAYDLNPGLSQSQSLMITDSTNEASLTALLEAHDAYFISRSKALSILAEVRQGVSKWPILAKRLHLPQAEVSLFSGRLDQFHC